MRRNLQIALESINQPILHTVSLEEEQVMLTDATVLASEVNQELNECDRIIEISDALEDLAVIADQIETASPTEIALIETAGDMAVAGTDIEPEEIVPSLESFQGKRISTESLRERANQIWTNILEYLKKVWEKVEKFFYNITGVIPNVRKRLKSLEEKIKSIEHLSPRGTVFEINTKTGGMRSIVGRLMVEGKVPRNDQEVIASIENILNFGKFVYTANLVNRKELGEKISKVIDNFDPMGDLEAQAKQITDACDEFNSKQKLPSSVSDATASGSYKFMRTKPELAGGGTLVKKIFENGNSQTTLGLLDRLRHYGITFEVANTQNVPDMVKLPTVTLKTLLEVIKYSNEVLDVLEEYKRGAASKAVDKARKDLENASKKAAAACDKIQDQSSNAVTYLRSMLNYNAAFSRWVSNPAVDFAKYAMNEVNAFASFADMVVKVYEMNQK